MLFLWTHYVFDNLSSSKMGMSLVNTLIQQTWGYVPPKKLNIYEAQLSLVGGILIYHRPQCYPWLFLEACSYGTIVSFAARAKVSCQRFIYLLSHSLGPQSLKLHVFKKVWPLRNNSNVQILHIFG